MGGGELAGDLEERDGGESGLVSADGFPFGVQCDY